MTYIYDSQGRPLALVSDNLPPEPAPEKWCEHKRLLWSACQACAEGK